MSAGLEARGLHKAFSGIPVVRDVSFEAAPGEVLGLVGENGAGKSTLLNLLGGVHRPDAGELRLGGEPYAPRTPAAARERGVAFIHQELNLFANLSVAENLSLVALPRRFGLVDRATLATRARGALARVGLDVAPDLPVGSLGPGARQLLEIARALSEAARVVIFDEPTTSLTRPEAERLFEQIESLRATGHTLVYVSHALEDVRRICDRILVLRDGEVVGHGTPEELSGDRLVALMVGRPLTAVFPSRPPTPAAAATPALELRGLARPPVLAGVDLAVNPGEVVGVAGLNGAGRTELLRAAFGLDAAATGEVRVFGTPLRRDPRAAIDAGMCLVTEERRADGLVLDASVGRNLELGALPRFAAPVTGRLHRAALEEALAETARSVRLVPRARLDQPVRTLSGGNQQKVVLGKWLLTRPRVVLLDDPTRGVDVGAKQQIYRLVADLAEAGAGVVVVSSELEELLGLCDRILALRRGALAGEWGRADFDPERILGACLQGGGAA